MQKPIYLDNFATTPTDRRVVEAMLPYFTEQFGNPSSVAHAYGWEAEAAVKKSRQTIAAAINAAPEEIIFTSGATEADNLAIKGVAEAYFSKGKHLISCVSEHSAVLDPCKYLQSLGFEITFLPVQQDGLIDLELLLRSIRPETILISVMAANNEIGVLQNLNEIGAIARQHQVLFHTDAAQAIGKIPLDVASMKIDLMSLTAHKIYGPKGIGALYVRKRDPRVRLAPQLHGGGQEQQLRSGTLYTPQIVGFAKAIELALSEMESESKRAIGLRQMLQNKLSQLENIYFNGHPELRLPGSLSLSVAGVDGAALLLGVRSTVAVSSGSACASSSIKPSHVLTALGHSPELARASIRFGIGRFNTAAEIERVAKTTIAVIESLRSAKATAVNF